MAIYKTHTKFNLIIALPITIYLIYLLFNPKINYLLTFGGCFIYSTLFMNPDMDIANKIKLFSFKGLMTFPFRIYSFFFHHRGISHKIIIGTLTRVVFLFLFFIVIMFVIDYSLISKKIFLRFFSTYKTYIIYGFCGLCVADCCHLLLDIKKHK